MLNVREVCIIIGHARFEDTWRWEMDARGRDVRQGLVEVSACGVWRRSRGDLMSSVLGNGSASRDEVVGVDGGFRRRWVCSVAGELLEGVSAHQSAVQWVGGFGGGVGSA